MWNFKPICVTVWIFYLLRELAKSFASLSHMRPVGYINYPDAFSDCTDTSCMVSPQKPPQFSEFFRSDIYRNQVCNQNCGEMFLIEDLYLSFRLQCIGDLLLLGGADKIVLKFIFLR